MNMSGLKNVLKYGVLPIVTCAVMLTGSNVRGQGGDINSIHANYVYTNPIRTPGETVDFTIRLFSLTGTNFVQTYTGGWNPITADVLSPFEIRMETGNGLAYARKISEPVPVDEFRTDIRFRYTVRAGDLAFPMTIFGSAGSGVTPGNAFQFLNEGLWSFNVAGTTNKVVWKLGPEPYTDGSKGEKYDATLAQANIRLQTLSFETAVWKVPQTRTIVCTVVTDEPVSNNVGFYVWSGATNIAQIVEQQPGESNTWRTITAGSSQTTFTIRGINLGTTDIYLSPSANYTPGVTNYIVKTVTVEALPPPTVMVLLSGASSATLDETSVLDYSRMTVELSQTSTSNEWVTLTTTPSPQSNLTITNLVMVPSNTLSVVVPFRLPDGTLTSLNDAIIITPQTVTGSLFQIMMPLTLRIRNVAPEIVQPSPQIATRGVQTLLSCTVTDVAADLTNGMTFVWSFSDGSTNKFSTVSQINHTFTTPLTGTATYNVTVTATDKDDGSSALSTKTFTVNVSQPVPKPKLSVVTSAFEYNETNTPSTGNLILTLSEAPATESVWVRLEATLNGLVQSNVVFSATNAVEIGVGYTNSQVVYFSVPDGTLSSFAPGIDINPIVVTPAFTNYYAAQSANVRVKNMPPKITKPDVTKLPTYFQTIPFDEPYTFYYTVTDVLADGGTNMTVLWTFDNGGAPITVTGTAGMATVTLSELGAWYVKVEAIDKDFGEAIPVEFTVNVVAAPPPPMVSILPQTVSLDETNAVTALDVRLSTTFTNPVTVRLDISPATNAVNGAFMLSTNFVTMAKGHTNVSVIVTAKDGTPLSGGVGDGFSITPVIVSTPAASATFVAVPGVIKIQNLAPVIINPVVTTNVTVMTQYFPHRYDWEITDVAADLTSNPVNGIRVTWYFGDNAEQTFIGRTGTVYHTYASVNDMQVRVVAQDKDGATSEVRFNITVKPAKKVLAKPVGPNSATYYGATGVGKGWISSANAMSPAAFANNEYTFLYEAGVTFDNLTATPYPSGGFDSFFFTWVGGVEQGLPLTSLDPYETATTWTNEVGTTIIALSDVVAGTVPEGGSMRQVKAIFSREYLAQDNMGDINQDGIPDTIAFQIEKRSGMALGALPPGLTYLKNYNLDKNATFEQVGDYMPIYPNGNNEGVFDFRPIGLPFTAYQEVRGMDGVLDLVTVGGTNDWANTDPTEVDTDGDTFPDGWEYYFWRQAKIFKFGGVAYNPLKVGEGTAISWKTVVDAFLPNGLRTESIDTTLREVIDFDKDGLLDIEELTLGTNPIHWDTDGDGMCDGWEVFYGLNPNDPRDGLLVARNNPDGDYMAKFLSPRQFVTVTQSGVTNTYLATNAVSGVNLPTTALTTWYYYGNTNAQIAVGHSITNEASMVFVSSIATNAWIMHFQVYTEFGFDPRTAWRSPSIPGTPNTAPFTSVDEFLLLKFMTEVQQTATNMPAAALIWENFSTDPLTPDSDASPALSDRMPDGWELYVARGPSGVTNMVINPWNPLDGDLDADGDLANRREFAGFESLTVYVNPALYGNSNNFAQVSIIRDLLDPDNGWTNKRWPSNPWKGDTDDDGLSDAGETAFIYGNATAPGAGGGLNPCSMDTDDDRLTDTWEVQFAGTPMVAAGVVIPPVVPGTPATPVAMTITNGMDGTVGDAMDDWDYDGLLNYQEYWIQAVRGFRYDIPASGVGGKTLNPGLPMTMAFNPKDLFILVSNEWDTAFTAAGTYLLLKVKGVTYVSTSPIDPDTDKDGMDDYYEMFHGLNPILGTVALPYPGWLADRVALAYPTPAGPLIDAYGTSPLRVNDWGADLPMNFVTYPWLAGVPEADPDVDGLRNFEEMLMPNTAAPPYSHTDPSPIWQTDDSNSDSLTARFYSPLRLFQPTMFYWPADLPPNYVYSFEINEGYDTDNDGISDKSEMTQGASGNSDPLDHDDPIRRQSIWFAGTNSAAQTVSGYSYGEWGFRSFTVELWAKPEVANRDQVLIERPIWYEPSDLSTPTWVVRHNFRIGIAADGRVYAMFENAGLHDPITGVAEAYGPKLTNQWVHIAARMDGAAGLLTLLLNGEPVKTVHTDYIPANGVLKLTTDLNDPDDPGVIHYANRTAFLVVGAANNVPGAPFPSWNDYSHFYQGSIDEVRVWDGVRSMADIKADFRKRYTRTDLLANRLNVRLQEADGYTRVGLNTNVLMSELIYHYTFDNLFSAQATNILTQVPRGFNNSQVSMNRPANTVVGWWDGYALRSTAYADYGYIPWIENGIGHLSSVTISGPATNRVVDMGSVRDSVYWSGSSTGGALATNSFPNSSDPYGYVYDTYDGGRLIVASDLLPMGGAFAMTVTNMWDDQGPSGFWSDARVDSDSDGLADWWETLRGLDINSTVGANGWYGLYGTTGMINGERYLRDLADGLTASGYSGLVASADSDGDGMPDWWEQMFGLNANSATGVDGADGDPDEDGLSNLYEYWAETNPFNPDTNEDGISDFDEDADNDNLSNGEESYVGTNPGLKDTDDDGINDDVEVRNGWNSVSSASPGRQNRVLSVNGLATSYVEVPENTSGVLANRLAMDAFTLIANVYPTNAPAVGSIAELIVREVAAGKYNYRLSVDSNMCAKITYRVKDDSGNVEVPVPLTFALPLNRWSTVAVVLDDINKTVKIFINGAEAAQTQTVQFAMAIGDYGVNMRTKIGRGFAGYMDDVSIMDANGTRLSYNFDDITSYDATIGSPAFGSVLYPLYSARGQVEDTSVAVNTAVPDWSLANWYKRFSTAGTLAGGAKMVFFRDDGLSEAQVDSDGDGLPDQWELANGFDPMNPDSNGNSIADGLEDTDGDGLRNYYEYLAGLNPRSASTDGVTLDVERDEDGDGLVNLLEQTYGTMPNRVDTDDDGISDYEEVFGTKLDHTKIGISDPLASLSPFIPRGLQVDGTGAMIVTNQVRHALTEWTVAAWVQPNALAKGVVLARSFENVDNGLVNYELGVEVVGGVLCPYARYSAQGITNGATHVIKVGHATSAPGSIPVNGTANQRVFLDQGSWTHLAAVYAPAEHTLSLYVNGDCVAYRTDAIPLPIVTDVRWTMNPQLIVGAQRRTGAVNLNGFVGKIDDVRIAAYATTEAGIRQMMGKRMVEDTSPVIPTNGTTIAKTAVPAAPSPAQAVPGEFLVGMLPSVDEAALKAKFKADYKVDVVRKMVLANALFVRVQAGQDVNVAKQKMKADAAVRYVEPNYIVNKSQSIPTDPRFTEQWGMHNTGQNGGLVDADIDAPEAWAVSSGKPTVIVAVIDTGVEYTHPDLIANMWINPGEIAGNGIDDDGNGYIDDVYGYDFANGDADPIDDHSHGTHCAGTIGAAANNGIGVAGLNWTVKVMALKFLDASGSGSTADAISCLDYAVAMGAQLSNNSWGGGGFSQALYDTIARARDQGHLFVAAAGNAASDNDRTPSYPASYDLDNIISVAATDNRDELAWFSNWGLTTVDIAAPGQDILSTSLNGGYEVMSGTSMAAPHVAGAAALILAVDGSLSYLTVKDAIMNNGDKIAAVDGKVVSGMRLNIGNILSGMTPDPGSGNIRVRALSAWFRFDDGGTTVEDFTLKADWRNEWKNAGVLVGTASNLYSAAYTGFGDTDADGLPDWWEEAVGLNQYSAIGNDGSEMDIDGDGLTNFSEYRASLARMARGERGLNPFLKDTNNDGITDANEDSDLDGLSNVLEQNEYKTDPGKADTDDDGISDSAELLARTNPKDSMSPKLARALTFTGGITNTVVFSDKVDAEYTARHSAREWTIETWVKPNLGMTVGRYPLISRKVIETGLRNYELGLTNGIPYVEFDAPDGTRVQCVAVSQIVIDGTNWTHIAGRFELSKTSGQNMLTILINGVSIFEKLTGVQSPVGAGDVVLGSPGFNGQLRNTRIWRISQTDEHILGMMNTDLMGGGIGTSGYLSLTGSGYVKESAVTLRNTGETVDMLHENWTLECWVRTATTGGRLIARRNQAGDTITDFNYCLEVTETGTIRGRFNMEYGVWIDTGPVFAWVAGEAPDRNNIVGAIPVNRDGKWHHVAYVRDANFCYLYVDGLLDAKQARIIPPAILNIVDFPDNYWRVKVEGGPVILGETAVGEMDEIRIWNRELSAAEIKVISQSNLSGTENGLVSYFNFDFQIGDLAGERALMRDPDTEYGIYIPDATRVVGTSDGPPIVSDPLFSIQGIALIGLFLGNDGGITLEDRVYRMGSSPFTQEKYAGRIGGGVSFGNIVGTLDSDFDGIPDAWESLYGLDFYDNTGENGALGDLDGDGLSNYAEYQISKYGFANLNPTLFSTTNNVPDYFRKEGVLYYGEMFTDHDFMEDAWEDLWPLSYISRFVYDPHMDADQDGWSNWAECRYGSNPSSGATNDIPIPTIEMQLAYNGVYSGASGGGKVVIFAYKAPEQIGPPDAIYTTELLTTWPANVTFKQASSGYILEGTNYLFAFLDLDDSVTWNAGEPCGVATPYATEIGWDRNLVNIELTDYSMGYLRFDLAANQRTEDVYFGAGGVAVAAPAGGLLTRVRIMRQKVGGVETYRKVLLNTVRDANFPYLHEGNMMQAGYLDLDWGLLGVPANTAATTVEVTYGVYVNNTLPDASLTSTNVTYTFTNTFESVRSKISDLWPNGPYVYSTRPTFKWKMPDTGLTNTTLVGYSAFTLEVRRTASSTGTLVYSSGATQMPVRDNNRYYVWQAPIYADTRLPSGETMQSNTNYFWRVIPMNAKFATADPADAQWSDFNVFRVDVNLPMESSGYGVIQARVKYYGPATNLTNRVKVQVFQNAGFVGLPVAEYCLTNAALATVTSGVSQVNAVLRGIEPNDPQQPYYVRAFIDSNTNVVRDIWESWGYANYFGVNKNMYIPKPVQVSYLSNPEVVDIAIEDADTDQDWFPDVWEYEQNPTLANFLTKIGPRTGVVPDGEVNPPLAKMSALAPSSMLLALAQGTTDQDNDGLDDMTELFLASNVKVASTAGDGYTDGDKSTLGLAPTDYLSVNLTGLGTDANEQLAVGWTVAVQKSLKVNRTLFNTLSGTEPDQSVTYQILYTPTLLNANWTEVQSGSITLNGVQALESAVKEGADINPDSGFFRVRLLK